MTAANRATVRAAFASLLNTALVSSGSGIVQAVYAYRAGDFGGQSPVVVVTSAGSLRERYTFQGTKPSYLLDTFVFVAYSEGDTSWDAEDSEDALDDIEAKIAEVLDSNQRTANWNGLTQEGPSNAREDVDIGGVAYRREVITIRVD